MPLNRSLSRRLSSSSCIVVADCRSIDSPSLRRKYYFSFFDHDGCTDTTTRSRVFCSRAHQRGALVDHIFFFFFFAYSVSRQEVARMVDFFSFFFYVLQFRVLNYVKNPSKSTCVRRRTRHDTIFFVCTQHVPFGWRRKRRKRRR